LTVRVFLVLVVIGSMPICV